EMRSTGGLLRVREFVMKDLYSFHTDEKDLAVYFKKVIKAYHKIFERCGLRAVACRASGGSIGGSETYEFQVLASAGEDKVSLCEKCGQGANAEEVEDKEKCPKCGAKTKVSTTIEAGHVFSLGTKYSESLGAYFVDKDGQKKPIWMGCYGIGIGRLMATVVEAHHDDKGIIWPPAVAPYTVHLISIDSVTAETAEKLYGLLEKSGVDVLFDDRGESAGVKLKDADLIGVPVRVVVSKRSMASGGVEVSRRDGQSSQVVGVGQLADQIAKFYDER
ncbi:His/Gly/Thr/Pro-type tRNA ligase C-terminal domain-containing protein, partial [Candidatus Parcubacteria bacterium]|nr:His/Gly/Thr/Pro-type tRNA ligase C-terminal domain-containing protein [Candidatus Parcubacteria bacterium]